MEERKHGIEGYFSTQERLEELSTMKMEQDELKGKTLDEITGLIKTLNNRISSKKAELDPILKEVKPLRAKIQVKSLIYLFIFFFKIINYLGITK
jgi:intraflagellar transport protein 81